VGVALVVLGSLARFWVPTELARRASQRDAENELRRNLEQSLQAARENEDRFMLASSASRDFVWDTDLRTGHVYTSPRFVELLGYGPDEWPPTVEPWRRIVHPEDLASVDAAMAAAFKGKTPTYEARFRALRKDGTVLHLHATGATVREPSGRATRFAGFVRDVTQDLLAESARVQSQKLESVGLLAGGIAHDFNNLLTVVSASLSLAEMQAGKGEPVTETLDTAMHAVRRAAVLTRQLLSYAGRSPVARAPLDLNQVVESIGELLAVSVPRKVVLERRLEPGLPPVLGDESQLQQVVMNLIVNAAEAIGDLEGKVTLRTDSLVLDAVPEGVVGEALRGAVVRLTVTDTGCGMSAEVQSRLFDPFFSTKGTGRGLGLAALVGILRSHGGAVGLSSAPGRGTSFTIYLPALDPARAPRPVASKVNEGRKLAARVLLVDDEALLRQSASRLLKMLGCSVEQASTGAEAVARVGAGPDQFDVVLMDVTMPEMDGYEAARRIAVLAPRLPIILSSGYSWQGEAGLPAGVGSLEKPYDVAKLEAALRAALGQS
jgi:PAS domain S-box-containing protein